MEFQVNKVDDVLVLKLAGHLDTAAAMPLEVDVLKMIESGEHQILVDCTDLEYVNSSGLKVFLVAAKRLDALGGKLITCALAPNVYMIFEMIGFTKILTISSSYEAAMDTFGNRPSQV